MQIDIMTKTQAFGARSDTRVYSTPKSILL